MPINWDDFEPTDTAVATPEVNWDDFEPTAEPAYDSRNLAGDIHRQVQNPIIEQPDLTPANLGSDEQMRAAYNRDRIANRPTAAALADEQAKLREQGDATTWQAGTSWFRGAMQTGLEGTGNAIMAASALAESMLNSGYAGMDATPQEVDIAEQIREERKGMTPSQIREEMERNPVYMAGRALAEVAPEVHRAEDVNLSELSPIPIPGAVDFSLTGAGKTVGGFLPAALMGPAAPLGFGFQSAGEHLHNDYQHLRDQGLSPDDAAEKTSQNALASGSLQTALFAVLPGPLKKMGDAAIDKLAYEGVKRFVAGRVAQAGKGFTIGATTAAGENIVNEQPWYHGLGEAGAGLALIDAMMPRGMTRTEAKEYRHNAIDSAITKQMQDLAVHRENIKQAILANKPLEEKHYEELHQLEQAAKEGQPLTPQEADRLKALQFLTEKSKVVSSDNKTLLDQVKKQQGIDWEARTVEGGWDEQYNGNVAYFDKTAGKMVINPSELSQALSGMKPGERKAYVESLFSEEGTHGLVEDAEAEDFYNNSTALEKSLAIRRYTMSLSGKLHGKKLTPAEIGHEMIRAKIQQALGHKATEVTATQGVRRDIAKGMIGLENLMFKLRKRTRGGKSDSPVNMQQALIDTVVRKAQRAKMAATGGKVEWSPFDLEKAEQLGRRGPMSPSYQPAPETRKFSESFRDLEGPQKITNSSNNPDMLTTREYGMKMRSVADLDEMLRLNNQARTRLRELKEKGTARTPAEVKEYFALMGRTQFPREMVETATNTGGWSIENERNKPGATALSEDRPLDWKKNPEVEAWLRQHGEEMGIKLPEKTGPESPQYNKLDAQIKNLDEEIASLTERANKADINKDYDVRDQLEEMIRQRKKLRDQYRKDKESGGEQSFAMSPRYGMSEKAKRLAEQARRLRELQAQARGEELPEELRTKPKEAEYPAVPPEERVGMEAGGVVPPTAAQVSASANQIVESEIKATPKGSKAEAKPAGELTQGQMIKEHEAQYRRGAVEWDRPSYKKFVESFDPEGWGKYIKPGQLREAWQDAVWSHLINASPERLGDLRKALGLERKYGARPIVPVEKKKGFELEGEQEKQYQDKVLDRQNKLTAESKQRYRNKIVGAIAKQLIGESIESRASLDRREVGIDDVDFSDTKSEFGPYREITSDDIANPKRLNVLLRDQWRGSSVDPETASRRLIAVEGSHGRIYLLSTYNDAGVQRVVEPAGTLTGVKPFRPLNEAFLKQYRPFATILLTDPVKGLRQRFASEAEFMDKIGQEAKERTEAIDVPQPGYSHPDFEAEGTPGLEGEGGMFMGPKRGAAPAEARHPALKSKSPLTEQEARAVLSHIKAKTEAGDVKSKDDVKTSLRELLLKAKKKKTRAADMAALNAYRKIFNKVLADHKDWTDIEIIDWIVQKVFYMAKTAESAHDFTGALIDEFGVRQRAREVDVRKSARGKELTKANIRPPTRQESFAGPFQTKAAPRAEIEPAEPGAYIPKSVQEDMPAEEAGRRLLKAKDITLRTYRKKGAVLPLEIAGKMAGLTPEQIAKAKEMGYEPPEESEGHRLARGLAMQQHLQETSGVKVSLKNAQRISDLKHGPLSPQYRKGRGKERTDMRSFMTSTERVLNSFGSKPVDPDQLKNTIRNKIPKIEWDFLTSLGLKEAIEKAKDKNGNVNPKEVDKWIKTNGPQVTVSTYSTEDLTGGADSSSVQSRLAAMRHSFWDELTPEKKEEYRTSTETLLNRKTQEKFLEDKGWNDQQIQKAAEFFELGQRLEMEQEEGIDEGYHEDDFGEPMPETPAETYQMAGISPKPSRSQPIHRVDVHLPNAVHEGRVLHAPEPSHAKFSNTVGWAAIQFENLPGGEKTAHIFEVQSDWHRDWQRDWEALRKGTTSSFQPQRGHPLLPHYKRLVMKAAVEYARKMGADSFTVTDFPTAAMTEHHDEGAHREFHPNFIGEWAVFDGRGKPFHGPFGTIGGHSREALEKRMMELEQEENVDPDWNVRKITENDTRLKIPHEEGMRFNYDASYSLVDRETGEPIKRFVSGSDAKRYVEHLMDKGQIKRDALDPKTGTLDIVQGELHKIASELAGQEGQPVSMGSHQNAFITREYIQGLETEGDREDFETEREAMEFAGGDGRVYKSNEGRWVGEKPALIAGRQRPGLVFADEKGKPKTDASGLKYPMPEERSEPYSMFGPQSPSYHVPRKAGAFVSKAIREFGSVYDEWMVDRMVRLGGHVADQAGTLFRHIIDREKEIYGGMTLKLDKARLMAGGTVKAKDTVLRKYLGERVTRVIGQVPSPKMMKAVHWMNEIKPIKGAPFGGTWKGVTVFDNPKWVVPDYVEELAKAAREQNLDVGKILQTVIPGFKAGGLYQRNITALGYDIIRQGRGEMWQKWTAATAKANGRKVLEVREFFREFKELLDTPGVDTGLIEKVNQDFARKFPKVVTHIKSMGQWQAVLHADLFNYLENSARRASHIVAFREQFPNTPDGKEKLVKAKKAVSVEMGAEGQQAMEAMLRTMQGIPTDDYSRAGLLGPTRTLGQAFRYMNNTVGTLMSKMALTGQMVVQPGENIAGSIPVFLGYKNYLRGMAKVRQLYGEQEQRGAVNRAIYDFSWNKNSPVRSAFRIAGNTLSKVFMEQALNELQEASAAATARVVAERINAGTLTAWEERMLPETFKAMGFPKDEISAMMLGDQQLLDQFERKASAFLTSGNKAISEGSQIGANRLFNSIFRFQSYPMMKANQLRKVATNVAEAFTKGDATAKKRAAEQFARFFLGNAAQGAATVAITNLLFGGFQGLKVRGQEAKDEPVKFLLEAFLSTVSGPLYLAYNAMKYKGVAGYSDAVARLIFPYAVFSEMSDAASSRGRYRDLDAFSRVGEFLKSRTPGFKAIEQGMAMFGLSNKDKKLDAALDGLYRWKRDTFGFDERRSFLTQDNREDFRIAMRKAVDALKSGDADKFQKASQEAELQKSKMGEKDNLSFAGRKVLRDAQGTPLNPDQMDALRKRIGRDAVDRLEYFDLMLDAAGKGNMLPKHDQ